MSCSLAATVVHSGCGDQPGLAEAFAELRLWIADCELIAE